MNQLISSTLLLFFLLLLGCNSAKDNSGNSLFPIYAYFYKPKAVDQLGKSTVSSNPISSSLAYTSAAYDPAYKEVALDPVLFLSYKDRPLIVQIDVKEVSNGTTTIFIPVQTIRTVLPYSKIFSDSTFKVGDFDISKVRKVDADKTDYLFQLGIYDPFIEKLSRSGMAENQPILIDHYSFFTGSRLQNFWDKRLQEIEFRPVWNQVAYIFKKAAVDLSDSNFYQFDSLAWTSRSKINLSQAKMPKFIYGEFEYTVENANSINKGLNYPPNVLYSPSFPENTSDPQQPYNEFFTLFQP